MRNLLSFCCLLIVVAVGVKGYDFSDPAFNEYLARDLELFTEASLVSHPRARRDEEATHSEKCRRKRFKYCCGEEVFERLMEDDKNIKRDCYKQVTGRDKTTAFHSYDPFVCDKEKLEKRRKEFICVAECSAKKKDLITDDGHLKVENLKSLMKKAFESEDWFVPKINGLVDKCAEEVKPEGSKIKTGGGEEKENVKEEKEKESCNEEALKFAHCFWKEFQFSCPENLIKDQKICEKVREKIKNKDFFSHKHEDE